MWNCTFSLEIWEWIHQLYQLQRGQTFVEILKKANSQSEAVSQAWFIAVFSVMVELWKSRNCYIYDEIKPSIARIKARVLDCIRASAVRIKGKMFNSVHDLVLLKNLGIGVRNVNTPLIKICRWYPPPINFIKICCDGAAKGNPGPAGAGVIIRDHNCSVIATIAKGLGNCSNFIAEVSAILLGIEWAAANNKLQIWVVSDSITAIKSFAENKVPWFARNRWNSVRSSFQNMTFSHTYREVNFAADALANQGSSLPPGYVISGNGSPANLVIENQELTYYRFK
ncbi:Ribonuclease H domain [Macleaya cordata]|uniref:Ribonuclease H domain n=1 Tax=Macleaya cordata TaxID=56857 RepID=A0A200Q7H4_MACCD|nr:Ribonuclease H domain [Macleaya cordata]